MLNYVHLESNVDRLSQDFEDAQPHRHIVIDDFLEGAVAEAAYRAFPRLKAMDALRDMRQNKAQDPDLTKFESLFQEIVFGHLHSYRFVNLVERIAGIPDLRVDPHLYAAGLAQSGPGGYLNVHIDNSSHPVAPWYRRLNLLVYLNPGWRDEHGGHLELWSPEMKEHVAILPIANRAVLFETHRESWHGHRRVSCPIGETRKSINLYYFTTTSPDGEDYYHVTSFRARAGETLNQFVFPIDNWLRSQARRLRRKKDTHAVLYDNDSEITQVYVKNGKQNNNSRDY